MAKLLTVKELQAKIAEAEGAKAHEQRHRNRVLELRIQEGDILRVAAKSFEVDTTIRQDQLDERRLDDPWVPVPQVVRCGPELRHAHVLRLRTLVEPPEVAEHDGPLDLGVGDVALLVQFSLHGCYQKIAEAAGSPASVHVDHVHRA